MVCQCQAVTNNFFFPYPLSLLWERERVRVKYSIPPPLNPPPARGGENY